MKIQNKGEEVSEKKGLQEFRSVCVIKYARISPQAKAPARAHSNDAGFDLVCTGVDVRGQNRTCHTGLKFKLPEGVWLSLRSRSSVCKTGWILSNGVGTIDNGYRGEVKAVFYALFRPNWQYEGYRGGDRCCQIIVEGVPLRTEIEFEEVPESEIGETERGEGGYGSTGR